MGFAKAKTAPTGAVFTQHHLLAEAAPHERERRQPKSEQRQRTGFRNGDDRAGVPDNRVDFRIGILGPI